MTRSAPLACLAASLLCLPTAAQLESFGTQFNPAKSLTLQGGGPFVGSSFSLGVKNTARNDAPPGLALLYVATAPLPNFPAGLALPGFGLSAPGATGEILLSLSPPNPILTVGPVAWAGGTSAPALLPVTVPANPALLGLDVYAQGALITPLEGFALGLTNGLVLELGNPGSAADVPWSSDFAGRGLEGSVNSVVAWNGGAVYAGEIPYASGVQVNNVTRWNGTQFVPMGAGFNGRVLSLAVVAGTLYASGDFTASGATPLPNVARWSGSQWLPVGSGAPDVTNDLYLAADGSDLLLLGSFTQVGNPPVAAASIARWNGSQWSSLGHSYGSSLQSAVRLGSTLYVGGSSLDAFDGVNWSYDLISNRAPSLAVFQGSLYVAGSYYGQDAQGAEMDGIARWNGNELFSLGGIVPDGFIRQIQVDNGQLLAIGDFASVPGPNFAYWDGNQWTGAFGGLVLGSPVAAARVGSELLVGGGLNLFFQSGAGLVGLRNAARWTGSGWAGMGPGSGLTDDSSYVQGLGTYQGKLAAVGSMRRLGDQPDVRGVALWDGVAWTRLGAGLDEAFGNPTGKFMTEWNGKLVVSGYFQGAGGGQAQSENVAAWNGSSWESLAGGFTSQGARLANLNGQLIAASGAGVLGNAIGTPVTLGHVARWTGSAWSTIGTASPSPSLTDFGLTVWNGRLIYGAAFAQINGVPAANIAAWDGTGWSALGAGFNNFVTAVAVHGGELYAAGLFTASGSTPIPSRVARWNGTQWQPVGGLLGPGVVGLASVEGRLYATGLFSNAAGARISVFDGTSWGPLGAGLGNGPLGNAGAGLAIHGWGGGLFVGGFFRTAGDKYSPGLARWQP